jgi:hypothetical protein
MIGGDTAVTYSATFVPHTTFGDQLVTTSLIEARLVVTYQTSDPLCSSQASFLVEGNRDKEIKLMIPQGKTVAQWQGLLLLGALGEMTLPTPPGTTPPKMSVLPPRWKLCEDNQLNHLCARDRFNVSQARAYADEGDSMPGMFFSCTNKFEGPIPGAPGGVIVYHVRGPRYCRVMIQYAP